MPSMGGDAAAQSRPRPARALCRGNLPLEGSLPFDAANISAFEWTGSKLVCLMRNTGTLGFRKVASDRREANNPHRLMQTSRESSVRPALRLEGREGPGSRTQRLLGSSHPAFAAESAARGCARAFPASRRRQTPTLSQSLTSSGCPSLGKPPALAAPC